MDQLTGLPTHKDLAARPADFIQPGTPGSGILLDIDGFSWVNHQHGHAEGDSLLRRLGQWLAHRSEELSGRVLRIAGDEFLILLPGRAVSDALLVARSLVAAWADLGVPYQRPNDTRTFLSLSAIAFPVGPQFAARLEDVRSRASMRLHELELAERRNYGIVGELEIPSV